jgi:hypothetical protein
MNWKKAIGFGVLIWILMFVIVCVFIAFEIYDYTWMKAVTIVIGAAIVFFFAKKVKPSKIIAALGYGLIWVVISIILDALITTKFNENIFKSKTLWVVYILTLLIPLLAI